MMVGIGPDESRLMKRSVFDRVVSKASLPIPFIGSPSALTKTSPNLSVKVQLYGC